jgi:hypothetical protein
MTDQENEIPNGMSACPTPWKTSYLATYATGRHCGKRPISRILSLALARTHTPTATHTHTRTRARACTRTHMDLTAIFLSFAPLISPPTPTHRLPCQLQQLLLRLHAQDCGVTGRN